MKKTNKWCYSFNYEDFQGSFDTKEECIKEAEENLESGDKYSIGLLSEFEESDMLWFATGIGENLIEQAQCEVGDCAEDWLDQKEEKALEQYIADYLWKNHKPTFMKVEDIEELIKK